LNDCCAVQQLLSQTDANTPQMNSCALAADDASETGAESSDDQLAWLNELKPAHDWSDDEELVSDVQPLSALNQEARGSSIEITVKAVHVNTR
jgi:hypothetical protein